MGFLLARKISCTWSLDSRYLPRWCLIAICMSSSKQLTLTHQGFRESGLSQHKGSSMPLQPKGNLLQCEVRAACTGRANCLIRSLDLGCVTDRKIGTSSERSAQPTAYGP